MSKLLLNIAKIATLLLVVVVFGGMILDTWTIIDLKPDSDTKWIFESTLKTLTGVIIISGMSGAFAYHWEQK